MPTWTVADKYGVTHRLDFDESNAQLDLCTDEQQTVIMGKRVLKPMFAVDELMGMSIDVDKIDYAYYTYGGRIVVFNDGFVYYSQYGSIIPVLTAIWLKKTEI